MSHLPKETSFKPDIKIEKYGQYRDRIHKNFKWNPRTVTLSIIFAGIVPFFLFTKIKQSLITQFEREGRGDVEMINLFDAVREHPIPDEERRLERARRFKRQYEMAEKMNIEKKLAEEKADLEKKTEVALRPEGDFRPIRPM